MKLFSKTGKPISSLDINELSRLMNYPSYPIIRKDLISILIQRTIELNIHIQYDHDIIDLLANHLSTSVHFSNGHIIKPDIVIGADGRMNTLTRKYVNGSNKPIYQGFINGIGFFEQDRAKFSEISVSDY
jgi:FAD-dependent urate hydroxylase